MYSFLSQMHKIYLQGIPSRNSAFILKDTGGKVKYRKEIRKYSRNMIREMVYLHFFLCPSDKMHKFFVKKVVKII